MRWPRAVAALLLITAAACSSGTTRHAAPTTTTTAAPTTTAPAGDSASTAPANRDDATGFSPRSATFISADVGWALGSDGCDTCLALRHTTNGGASWSRLASPPMKLVSGPRETGGVSQVRFANANDGWLFAPDLWSTHDGGEHWAQQSLPPMSDAMEFSHLEASAGTVTATVIANNLVVATSPIGRDDWTMTRTNVDRGGGPVPDAAITLQGSSGWIVMVNRQVSGGLRLDHGRWVDWTPPCLDKGGGVMLAASTATNVVAVCDEGSWSGSTGGTQWRLYVSSDAGTTFGQVGDTEPVAAPVTPVPGTIIGSSTSSDGTLAASFDGGGHWKTVYRPPAGGGVQALGFTTHDQGLALVTGPRLPNTLLITRDRGHTWRAVAF